MLKLPVCPYCKTVYRYKDTKNALKQKESECYHCRQTFKATIFPSVLVLAAAVALLCVGINILMLSQMKNLNLILLFSVTIFLIIMGYFLVPFFISFKKTENDKRDSKRR